MLVSPSLVSGGREVPRSMQPVGNLPLSDRRRTPSHKLPPIAIARRGRSALLRLATDD